MKNGLLALLIVALVSGVISTKAEEFSFEELNADLDTLGETVDMSNISTTTEDFKLLRALETSIAVGGKKRREIHPVRFTYTKAAGLNSAWPKCKLFMSSSGEYSSYGRIVKNYINEKLHPVFLSNNILGMSDHPNICPNWAKFDEETKVKFWVWTMASISAIESACNVAVNDKRDVTGEFTFGLYQLERKTALRFANRRFAPNCMRPTSELRKPIGSIRCAMDMLVTQLIDQKENIGEFDGRIYPGPGMEITTYFNEFHHAWGGYIGQLMREFKPCHSTKKSPKKPGFEG